jgi:hypothetical protein
LLQLRFAASLLAAKRESSPSNSVHLAFTGRGRGAWS